MVGGSQVLLEGLQSMMQDDLTGRKEVVMTLAFLPYSLFLQYLHKPYMFLMECSRPRRPQDGILTKDLGIGKLRLFESIAPNCFGLLDGHPVAILSLQDHLGAVHLGIKDLSQMENFGSLIGCSLFGFVLAQLQP